MVKEKVLSILEKNRLSVVTGGDLARSLGVSRTSVWKAVHALRDEGYDIQTISNTGYAYISSNDVLNREFIRKRLNTKILGSEIEILKTTDSTNSYIKRKELNTAKNGLTVISDGQTGGQGRLGRPFSSASGDGVYMSFLLKPHIPAENVQFLTICAAVAVCRALLNVCGVSSQIKWVNDVFCDGKKICGILTEAVVSAELGSALHVVVGIGINTGTIAKELEDIAASVYTVTGKRGYRNDLIAGVLSEFEAIYIEYTETGNKQGILNEYTDRLFILGRTVMVNRFDSSFEAVVKGVGDGGELIVENKSGERIKLQSGEVGILW
ncbi:MAG: biotin--[acetyl-CoA-carboxylase] ligase [Oscillospiraceae bacterium]|nr:biotin--[acetyl-CoA-carboxylase] ligase [Oscillospiraceae bacterium]